MAQARKTSEVVNQVFDPEYKEPGSTEWQGKGIEPPTVTKAQSGDQFYTWADESGKVVLIGVRGLRREKDELWGVIEVQFRRNVHSPVEYILAEERINFRSGSSKTNHYRALERREKNEHWEERINWIAKYIQDSLRSKITPIRVSDIKDRGATRYVMWPMLEAGEVCAIYGDGGSTKSLMSQLVALSCADGISHIPGFNVSEAIEVLILDYETNPETTKWRLSQLAKGHGIADAVLEKIHDL